MPKSKPLPQTTEGQPEAAAGRGRLKQLAKPLKPLTVYGFTIFTNAALSFATFSLLTHYLTEVDYGIINLYNSFIMFLIPFVGIGVSFVLNVDYFKMEKEQFGHQFTNALAIPVAACLLFTLLLVLFPQSVQRITKVNYLFVAISAFTCLLIVLNDVISNLIRNRGQYYLFAGYTLGKNVVEVGLTLLFVVGLGFHWAGRLGSNFLALSFAGVIIFVLVRKWKLFTGGFDKKTIMAVVASGLPFVPERLALFAMGYSDRFFIDHFRGTADVGYYGAGAQLAMIVHLSILTLNNTFYPTLFRGLSRNPVDKGEIRKVIGLYIGLSALVTGLVIICIPFFFRFFIGPAFQPGKVYAIYLTIGFFFWSIYNVFVAFLLNQRRNKLIMAISIFGMVVSILANFINVRRFGALGATYTSMIVYFSMALVTFYFVNKEYKLKELFS